MSRPWGSGKPQWGKEGVPPDHKEYIGRFAAEHRNGNSRMRTLTGLSKQTICLYTKHYKEGTRQTSGMGRQSDLRGSPASRVVETVRDATADDRAPDREDLTRLLAEAVVDTSGHKKKKITRRWVNRYMNKLRLEPKNAQHKSDARQEAERDMLNALSTVTGFQLVADMVPDDALALNFDATQCVISGGKDDRLEVIVVKDEPLAGPISTKNKNGGGMNYFVKFYPIISCGGVQAPLVFVLACESMGDEECDVFECPGLCKGDSDCDTIGYIVFTKSRAGNAKFYRWLNISVILPFIVKLRRLYALPASRMAVVVCDGELVQIDPYQDPIVQAAYAAAFAFQMKLCASTTAVSQPCDAWKLFSALHAIVQSMGDRWTKQPFLSRQIDLVMQRFGKLKPADKTRAAKGLLMIRQAVGEVFRSSTILNSFALTGLRPFSPLQIMTQFHQKVDVDALARTCDEARIVSRTLARKGQLEDDELLRGFTVAKDALNLGTLKPLQNPKDRRSIHQRRIVLCLHKEVVLAELNRKAAAAQVVVDKAADKVAKKRKREEEEAAKAARKQLREEKKAAKPAKVAPQPPLPPPPPQADTKGRRKRVITSL